MNRSVPFLHPLTTPMTRKNYIATVWPLTIAINGLIILSVFSPKISAMKGHDLSALPLLNAILNGLTFLSLLIARAAVRHRNTERHRNFIFLAFGFTFLFLISYLTYHFSVPATRFRGPVLLRYSYFFILSTHILLAAIIVPLAMYTMGMAISGDVARHRRIARWTMPIWLYVSLTGVIVYIMISPYYNVSKPSTDTFSKDNAHNLTTVPSPLIRPGANIVHIVSFFSDLSRSKFRQVSVL
ncbi:MAG TPA: DUF420 domain-containing protein [Puia sp.]|nr:DUF420 domain-containing protein [Puia sp.]